MSDSELFALLRAAFRFPITVAEVAAAEAEIDEAAIVLPESLRDPMAILRAASERERTRRQQ